jgi:hypothetical protein
MKQAIVGTIKFCNDGLVTKVSEREDNAVLANRGHRVGSYVEGDAEKEIGNGEHA